MRPPPFTPLVESLPATVPFVGAEAHERTTGRKFRARIGANESVFGPSPKAIEAMRRAAADVWMYGDPENHDLKAALARHHDVGPDNIAVGEGIDGLFGMTVRLFCTPGTPIVTSYGAYPTFIFHVNGFGARLITVPYRDDREDPAALLAAAQKESARLVYIANPNNPMGSWRSAAEIQELIDGLPDGALLVLDEAYSDTAPRDAIPPLDVANPNVLRFRTFSKAYGMAGMRVGYAIGAAPVVKSFDKIRNHFGMTRISQAAALAALADQAYLKATVGKIERARARIAEIAAANGLTALPSATNFVAIDCGRDGAFARRVLAELIALGVFVRMPGVAPLDRCIRVSAGKDADLAILAEALPAALASAAKAT